MSKFLTQEQFRTAIRALRDGCASSVVFGEGKDSVTVTKCRPHGVAELKGDSGWFAPANFHQHSTMEAFEAAYAEAALPTIGYPVLSAFLANAIQADCDEATWSHRGRNLTLSHDKAQGSFTVTNGAKQVHFRTREDLRAALARSKMVLTVAQAESAASAIKEGWLDMVRVSGERDQPVYVDVDSDGSIYVGLIAGEFRGESMETYSTLSAFKAAYGIKE